MARGVNKVILIGNLGDEPTIRTTNTGRNVASISMVTNESRRNAETGEYTEFAEWHRVTMWGKLADIAKQYLHKGSQIYVEGKLRTRSYDKDGIKRYVTEIVADEMQMLGSPRNGGNSGSYSAPSAQSGDSYGGFQGSPSQGSQGGFGGQSSYGAQPSAAYGQAPAGNGGYGSQNAGYGAPAAPAGNGYGQPQAQNVPVSTPKEPMIAGADLDDQIPF